MAEDNEEKSKLSISVEDLTSSEEVVAPKEVAAIDINTMNVRLLILCQNISAQENAAHYLVRRGWETVVVGGIKEAFNMIGEFRPDFVLLSVNLKSPKVLQIPHLLQQAFKIPVIVFGEMMGAHTMKRLQDIQAKYSLTGPASGPGIHRKVKNILHEIFESEKSEEKEIIERIQSRVITVSDTETEAVQNKKRGYTFVSPDEGILESKEDKLRRLYQERENHSEDSGSAADFLRRANGAQDFGKIDHKMRDLEDDLGEIYKNLHNDDDSNGKLEEQTDDENFPEEDEESLEELVKLAQLKSKEYDERQPLTTRTRAQHSNKKEMHTPGIVMQNSDSARNLNSVQTGTPSSKSSNLTIDSTLNLSKPELSYKDTLKATPEVIEAMEHFIVQCARNTAAHAVPPIKSHESASKCTVWPVLCSKMAGFIVVSHGGTYEEENSFCDQFIKDVAHSGAELCGNFQVDPHLITDLEHVDLKQHIKGELFTATILSGNNEIVIKLIEAQVVNPTVSLDVELDRAKINTEELVSDLSAGADLYLYMPKNNRYFMYLKMDTALSEKQKQKLLAADAALFISNKDIEKYNKSYVKNRTIQSIRDLKSKNKKAA